MLKSIGPYDIQKELVKGGMSTVYLAIHRELGRKAALKVIRPDLTSDPAYQKRFEREARLIARLEHPNLLQIYDFGRQEGCLWLAMELVEGEDMDALLKRSGPLPDTVALAALRQAVGALSEAHRVRIIHRDIKPANLLIKRNGTVKLADFGIAKDLETTDMTRADEMVGTPFSLAPEIIRGEPVTPSADLYAAGVCLYFAVTGRPPFEGASVAEVLDRIVRSDPPSFHLIGANVAEDVTAIIRRCMAKNPAERPTDADALCRELDQALRLRGIEDGRKEVEAFLASPGQYRKEKHGSESVAKTAAGDRCLEEGRPFDAIRLYKEALSLSPGDSRIESRIMAAGKRAVPGTATVPLPGPLFKKRSILKPVLAGSALLLFLVGLFIFLDRPAPSPALETLTPPPVVLVPPSVPSAPPGTGMTSEPLIPKQSMPAGRRSLAGRHHPSRSPQPAGRTPSDSVPASDSSAACTGSLSLYSEAWAHVFVDGQKVGRSPTKEPLPLPCGDHDLKLETNLGKQYFTRVTIHKGSEIHLTVAKTEFK